MSTSCNAKSNLITSTQGTYFIETKGSRAPNAACEGVDFTFNEVEYTSSVMIVQVQEKLIMIQGGILLKPFEMNHANKSGMVFKNDPNYGTIMIPVDEILTSERKLLESVYHGDASVLKLREDSEAEEMEPTILVIKEGDAQKEISLFLQEPQTICKEAMIGTDQPNLYVRMLGE